MEVFSMPTTKWWIRAPKDAEAVSVKKPDPATQPKATETPKADKSKGEVKVKDA